MVLAALAAATVVSFVLTPLAIRLAPRLGAIDLPDTDPATGRRVHRRPIPRTGGLAVAASFVGVGALGLVANQVFDVTLPGRPVSRTEVAALFAGVGVGAIIGYLDDRFELRARWQFIAQFVLAGIALLGGIAITRLPNPLGDAGIVLTDVAAVAATTLWIVGMLNSVNFVDGLDGLLGGIALIAVTTMGVFSLVAAPIQPVVAMLCALLAGSLLGFLPYNFHPARTFIGTAGVFAVGYALAVLSVLGTAKVAVALLVLGVPIIDTFWIIIRRVSAGRSPFSADRGHFHHRLLDLGLSHRQVVLLIYAICVVLAVLSLVLSGRGQISVFLIVVLGGGVALYLLTRRAQEALDRRSYPDDPEPDALDAVRDIGTGLVGLPDDDVPRDTTVEGGRGGVR
jgi:UDP-GlcNAc:undecaprenyl-phosphate/decaprenyl-phosphate GlcNAc-1-phosphate transferase